MKRYSIRLPAAILLLLTALGSTVVPAEETWEPGRRLEMVIDTIREENQSNLEPFVVLHSELLALSDLPVVRDAYAGDRSAFYGDIVAVLSNPESPAFPQVLHLVANLDIRAEPVFSKMYEIARKCPVLPRQSIAAGYVVRHRDPRDLPLVLECLRSSDPELRRIFLDALPFYGNDLPEKILDLLIEDIERYCTKGRDEPEFPSGPHTVSYGPVEILDLLGTAAGAAIPALEKLLQTEGDSPDVAFALCRIRPGHEKAFRCLEETVVKSDNPFHRAEVAEGLGRLDPASPLPIKQTLLRVLRKDPSRKVRTAALCSLLNRLDRTGEGRSLFEELLRHDPMSDFVFENCETGECDEMDEEDLIWNLMFTLNFLENGKGHALFFVEAVLFRLMERYDDYPEMSLGETIDVFRKMTSRYDFPGTFLRIRGTPSGSSPVKLK